MTDEEERMVAYEITVDGVVEYVYVYEQCLGVTTKGEQCKRLGVVHEGNSYRCWQHPRPQLRAVR